MANLIDAQNQVNVQKETTIAVVDLKNSLGEQFKEVFKLLVENVKVNIDTLNNTINSEEERNKKIDVLLDKTGALVANNEENNNAINNLVNNQQQALDQPDKETVKTQSLLARIGGNLKDYVKTSIKNRFEKSKFGKLVNFVKDISKDTKKQLKKKDGNAAAGLSADKLKLGTPKLDSDKIAKTMAGTMAKTLTPGAMVGAFLAKVLPLIIIFGLLLFLFLTSFFDMDVGTAILVTLGVIAAIILGLVIAFIAFKIIKAVALFLFQIMCEVIKLALAAGANAIAIIAILAIMIAFIIIAPLILLAVVIAFGLIVAAFVAISEIIVNGIVKVIELLFDFVIAIAELPIKILETLGKIVTGVMALVFGRGKDASEEATEKAADKLLTNQLQLHSMIKKTLNQFTRNLGNALAMLTGISWLKKLFSNNADPVDANQDTTKTENADQTENNPFSVAIKPLTDAFINFAKMMEDYIGKSKISVNSQINTTNSDLNNSNSTNLYNYSSYPTETANLNNTDSSQAFLSSNGQFSNDKAITKEDIQDIINAIYSLKSNDTNTKNDSTSTGFDKLFGTTE